MIYSVKLFITRGSLGAFLRNRFYVGAIYETIEAKGPTKDQSPFKCVLCEKELSTRTSVQFRLRQQPEQDRE